jgi:Ring finger domain
MSDAAHHSNTSSTDASAADTRNHHRSTLFQPWNLRRWKNGRRTPAAGTTNDDHDHSNNNNNNNNNGATTATTGDATDRRNGRCRSLSWDGITMTAAAVTDSVGGGVPTSTTTRRRQKVPSSSSFLLSDRRSRSNSWDQTEFWEPHGNRRLGPTNSGSSRRCRQNIRHTRMNHQSDPNITTSMWDFADDDDDEVVMAHLQPSSDDVVNLVAQQLGVAVPHAQAYPAHPSRTPTTIRREQRLRERELQPLPPPRRGPASMMPPPVASIPCNPVSPMVLQNLPTITIRYHDLYPDEKQEEDDGDEEDGSFSTDNLGRGCRHENPLESSSSSISIGLHLETYCCTICCDEMEVGTTAVRLPCAHIYHTDCITTWLSKFNTCPICRYALPTLADFLYPTSSRNNSSSRMRINLPRQQQQDMQQQLQQQQRPIQYTMQELKQFPISQLKHLYTSWIICTYQSVAEPSQKLPMELPTHIVDKCSMIDYMMECQVVMMMTPPLKTTKMTTSYTDLNNMSIRELKSLLLPVQRKHEKEEVTKPTYHIVEKQDLIDYILMEQHQQHQQQQQHRPRR